MRIDQLSFEKYSEHMTIPELYQTKPQWIVEEYHHISMASSFKSAYFVAVDGMGMDKYLNTLLLVIFKTFG